MKRPKIASSWMRGGAAALGSTLAIVAMAQSEYRIGENSSTVDNGPVRMARISYQSGKVDWRATGDLQWSAAKRNLPMRQGAQVWVPEGSRAEIQFDDGGALRMGGGAAATLSTLYSDNQGEFTEIKLTNGLATLHLLNPRSVYQIDTPSAAIKAYGPAEIRIGDTSGLEVAAIAGQCQVQGTVGKFDVKSGQYLNMQCPTCRCTVTARPKPDEWDAFNTHRDEAIYRPHPHLPSTIGLEADDLDDYGSWHHDPKYGDVWSPQENPGWRPYNDGSWDWVSPFGWTWVGDEPWAWAPYHYGTWVNEPYGWAWCPGPAYQPWSPAVVDFSYYNGNVAWCPLAPWEVRYPSSYFSVGIGLGPLALGFSIGSTCCYYPVGNYCSPYTWNNWYVNINSGVYFGGGIDAYYRTDPWLGRAWGSGRFDPANARFGGATYASLHGFTAGAGGYRGLGRNQTQYFTQGRTVFRPDAKVGPLSGPFNARPTTASFTPSRRFNGTGPSAAIASRSVYRDPVLNNISRTSAFKGNAIDTASGRTAAFGRGAAVGAAAGSALTRPQRFSSSVNRANAARGGASRYNRFNNVSKSPFTRGATGANRGSFSSAARRQARTPQTTARPSNRGTVARETGNRSQGARTEPNRATANANRARAASSAHRQAQPHRSVSRPANRPTRSTARPSRSSSGSRHVSSRPASRPQRASGGFRSAPSHPSRSFGGFHSAPSHRSGGFGGGGSHPAPRSSGGFGGGGFHPAPSRPSGGGGGFHPAPSRPSGGGGHGGGGGGGRRHGG